MHRERRPGPRADRAGGRRGRPGASAEAGYRRARRLRRRRRVETALWLLTAAGALLAASSASGRDARVGWAVGAGFALVVAAWRRPPADPERWRRGAAGEEATAALLDRLGDRRWAVLHDRRLPGSRANVDHLVIGRRGVWVVDSKAYRVPVRAGWRGVRVGGRRLDTSAVAWEASVVADRLGVAVRPLVAVHADGGLRRRGRRCGGVRVLPADAVVGHLRRARGGSRLGRAEVAEMAALAARVLPEA